MKGCKIVQKRNQIINWFLRKHKEWVRDNKLVPWAEKLGIRLNYNGTLDESQLFHLFVLAVLWNSRPTYRAEKGEEVFLNIKDEYTLSNFRKAPGDDNLWRVLKEIADRKIGNPSVFNILNFVTNGKVNNYLVWVRVKEILNSEGMGAKNFDENRLKRFYYIFNPKNEKRYYKGDAYLTKKVFLIFREIRIQFRNLGKYQYHPAICCVPDNHVEDAITDPAIFGLISKSEKYGMERVEWLLKISEKVAELFCKPPYELYDLPIFLAHKSRII